MTYNYLLHLFGISVYLVTGSVAREAIINGNVSRNSPYHYFVSISIPHVGHNCGGGIIGDEFILTAAHCVVIARNGIARELVRKPIFVLAETNDLSNPGIIVEVEKVIVPKLFRRLHSTIYVDDIAVLKLKRSLDLSNNQFLKMLTIPTAQQSFANKTTLFVGFGWHWVETRGNQQFGGRNDTFLRFAKAHVLSTEECKHQHPLLPNNKQYLCARLRQYGDSQPSGVCTGDSGGPLVFNGRSVFGILSTIKLGCSEKNSSAIYSHVLHFRNFIRRAMQNIITDRMIEFDA